MRLDLAIRGCRVLVGGELIEASIGVAEGRVAAIAKDPHLPKAEVELNAHGLIALPGMVDMHVHLRDPGYEWKEDFHTGTMAAACGGVTVVADMPNNRPPITTTARLRRKVEEASAKAVVDYALYAAASRRLRELDGMFREGVVGVKAYMASRDPELVVDEGLLSRVARRVARAGSLLLVHAEEVGELSSMGARSVLDYCRARGPALEYRGVKAALRAIAGLDVRLHLCHLSTIGSLRELRRAKQSGLKVTAETCPHYLLLTLRDVARLKALAKVDPPIRGWRHRAELWRAIGEGLIDALASDHAPHAPHERWVDDPLEAPSGIASLEVALPLMLDCVNRGLLSLRRLVELYSEAPSRILGLYPRKGALVEGADADVVLVSMSEEWRITSRSLHSKSPETPYEGRVVRGRVRATLVRGTVVAEGGEVKAPPGYGLMLRPRGG